MSTGAVKKGAAIFLAVALIVALMPCITGDGQAVAKGKRLGKVQGLTVSVKKRKATVRWKKTAGAKKYQVKVLVKKGKKWKAYKGKKQKGRRYAFSVKQGKVYLVKVRALAKKKRLRGGWTAAKKLSIPPRSSGSSGGGSAGGSGGGADKPVPWWETAKYPVDETSYVEFQGVKVYLGQDFTSELYAQLSGKAAGIWKGTRKKEQQDPRYICLGESYSWEDTPWEDEPGWNQADEWVDEKIYFFNTETYDPFLAVYVCKGQVVEIGSNGSPLGVFRGKVMERGETDTRTECTITDTAFLQVTPDPTAMHSGTLMMWMRCKGCGCKAQRIDGADRQKLERDIGFHYINAVRVAKGRGILKRSRYLEGVDLATGEDLTWTGTIPSGYLGEGIAFVDQRYGAQAWAETMDASGKCAHGGLMEGPCGGASYRNTVQVLASGALNIAGDGENCGGGTGGEAMVTQYGDSAGHWNAMMEARFRSVGVGISGGYHCQQFCSFESEQP